MTISTTTNKISYTGNNSTTVFAYNFKILADADLQIYNAGVLQTITTHYTISGAGDSGGGNVTFETAPIADASVVIMRNMAQTQQVDYVANDPFPAETHEGALDRLTLIAQDVSKDVEGAFRFADTVTDAGTITVDKNAADRANKLLAFDSSGGLSATQEIGTNKGNWGSGSVYQIRDIVKDTGTNNIFQCKTAHTSSGSLPITSNADSAKWDLLVDAASATTSQTAAATSATASASSATASASSATSSASSATSSASSATSSASSATSSASSATSSASSSTTSGNYSNKIDGAVTGTEFSSKAWALGGTGVTDTASRGAAKEWATAAEDDLVDGSEYSAKHYSLKAQTHATNAAANSGPYYSATTGTNTYVATPTPALTSYAEGVDIILKFGTGNTGSTTLNVSGLGAKDLKKADGSAFSSGELTSGQIQHFVYNGSQFRLMGTVAATEDLIKINTLDIFQNTINDMADHSDNLLETVDGFTDNFQDGSTQNNTAFDLTNSSGVTHDNTNKLWGNTDAATGANDDKPYTTEANYIQEEWDQVIVGANAVFTNGSATVTTSGTFPTNCANGRISEDGNNWYDITTRDSATQLTLSAVFAQSTVTGTFDIRMTEFAGGVVKLNDRGGANPITEYVSVADSYSQSSDVSAFLDINSLAITQNLNSQNAYYWLSFDPASSFGAGTEIVVPKPAIAAVYDGIDSTVAFISHFDGSDSSTTITDSSSNTISMTVNGSQTFLNTGTKKIGTASLKMTSSASSTDWVLSAANSLFNLSTTDWTVEYWYYTSGNSGGTTLAIGNNAAFYNNNLHFQTEHAAGDGAGGSYTTVYEAVTGASNKTNNTITAPTFSQWQHCAWVRQGTSLKSYLDGILNSTSVTNADYGWTGDTYLKIGNRAGSGGGYSMSQSSDVFMDELRISREAKYTGNFTPRTTAYSDSVTTPAVAAYIRPIAKNDSGTWKHNSNASANNTFTAATSTVNDMLHSVSQAVSSQAQNRLTGTEISSLVDADFNLTNGFTTSDSKLTRGLTLVSSSASQNPEVSLFRVNYDSDKADGTFLTRAFGGTNMPPAPSGNINTMVALIIDKRTTGTPVYEASSNAGTTWTAFSSWINEQVMSNGYTKRMAEVDVSAHSGARTSPLIRITNGSTGEDYDLKAIGIKYK